jgi:hypothetical protein
MSDDVHWNPDRMIAAVACRLFTEARQPDQLTLRADFCPPGYAETKPELVRRDRLVLRTFRKHSVVLETSGQDKCWKLDQVWSAQGRGAIAQSFATHGGPSARLIASQLRQESAPGPASKTRSGSPGSAALAVSLGWSAAEWDTIGLAGKVYC